MTNLGKHILSSYNLVNNFVSKEINLVLDAINIAISSIGVVSNIRISVFATIKTYNLVKNVVSNSIIAELDKFKYIHYDKFFSSILDDILWLFFLNSI